MGVIIFSTGKMSDDFYLCDDPRPRELLVSALAGSEALGLPSLGAHVITVNR